MEVSLYAGIVVSLNFIDRLSAMAFVISFYRDFSDHPIILQSLEGVEKG